MEDPELPQEPQDAIPTLRITNGIPLFEVTPYIQTKQWDSVRMLVTIGLLLMLGGVVFWSCVEAASWPEHWKQTKEMLSIMLPALTGLLGSVIGFYFGSGGSGSKPILGDSARRA